MIPADDVFVGRAEELALGTRLLQRAGAGRPTALLLTGEPGIGKSSVLAQLRGGAERAGFRTIALDADRVDAGMPYASLRLALEPLLGEEHDPSLLPTAELLADALAGRTRPTSSGPVPDLLRVVVEGWAFRAPVLLTIDDLHDADDGTATSVLHLIEQVRSHRVQVIATTCPAPVLDPAVGSDLDRLRATGRLEAVTLSALAPDEVTELVRRRTGLEPTTRLVELLAERSGRAPFFLIELLDAMTRSGDLTTVEGTVDAARDEPVALPSRVTTAVVHRVFGLGRDARAVAAAVAVIGPLPSDPAALLVAVTGIAEPRVAAALEALVEARLLRADGGRTRFVHAIARDAVYDDIGPASRRRLHGRVADALAALAAIPADDIEIAGHVLRATSGRDAVAAQRLAAAGRATVSSNPGAAADWYRAALAHLGPQEPPVVTIQLALADALLLSGCHDDAARVALAVLAAAGDEPTRTAAIAIAARAMVNNGAGPRAVELLERAARIPDQRTPAVLLMLAQALAWTNRRGQARALAAEARRRGDRDEQALADVLGVYVAIADGEPGTVARLADGLATREPILSPGPRATSRLARCVAAAFELDPADGVAIADSIDEAAPLADWFDAVAAWARYRQGRYAEIPWRGDDRPADGDDGRLAAGLRLAAALAAHVERDDPRAAEIARAAAATAPVPVFATTLDVARAMWHRRRGEHELAGGLLAACAAREEASAHVNLQALVLAHIVDAAVERGDGPAARAAADRLRTFARGGVATTMHVLLAGAVADADLTAARAALDHASRYELRADAGRARGLVGALTDDPGELAAAYRELGSIGAVWRQRVVAHELRRRGHRVPHGPAGSGDLSPVEVEVVSLVSAGLTNRQIAARMALSPKTIEVYLSRIYVKTGSRSRVELAVAARQSRAIAAARWASTST